MPESIIRAVVLFLLTVSTAALSTASIVLSLRRPDSVENDELSSANGVEEADFYSSPLDHLLHKTGEQDDQEGWSDRSAAKTLHLAAKDGDLVGTTNQARQVS